jgi:hypothetical protein
LLQNLALLKLKTLSPLSCNPAPGFCTALPGRRILSSVLQSFLACSFSLWLYSPILGLCRLHETFRFISVTISRTVSRTPWTGDQLVARPLLTAPGNSDDGEVGGMKDFVRGNRNTRRKPTPTPLCPPQIPLTGAGIEPGPPRWEASD